MANKLAMINVNPPRHFTAILSLIPQAKYYGW